MNRKLLGSGLIVLGFFSVTSCSNSQKGNLQQGMAAIAVPVTIDTIGLEKVTGVDTYPGTVVALNEVELRAEVGGYITAMYVKDGQKIQRGQKLYEIDRSRYASAYRLAQANVQIAKSNRDKAKKDAERYTKLAEQDAIAKQRVDYALTDLANAESQIAASEAILTNTAADLKRSVITAPLSGTIGISYVKLGALVSPGTTLLNTVSTNNPIAVDILIAQQEIPRFIQLQKNSSAQLDSVFTIELSDQTIIKQTGKIVAIDRTVDPQTGTIKVRISYPNPSGNLISGMNCTVKVLNRSPSKLLVIPFKAVTEQLGEFTVFVVGDSNKVEQRHIKTGMKVTDRVVVKEGLKPGETIVIDGVQNLRHGSVIQSGNAAQTALSIK